MLVALCFVAVLGIALTSYITMSYRALDLSNRSFQGTRSVQLAEKGMEEALWALNKADWATSAWTFSGSTANLTLSSLTIGTGSDNVTGEVKVQVTNYNSAGTAKVVTAQGKATYPNGRSITKQLQATANYAPLFPNLLGATGTITFDAASTATIYSYNSTLGTYGSQTPGATAVVAATGDLSVGNANIAGYAATPGTLTRGAGADLDGVSPAVGWDSTRASTNAFVPQFDITPPAGGSAVSTPYPVSGNSGPSYPWSRTIGTAGGGTEIWTIAGDLYLGQSQSLTIAGPVRLYINGLIYVYNGTAGGQIIINNSGNASLELHCVTGLYLAGQGIDNKTKDPKKCVVFYSGTGPSGYFDGTYNLTMNYNTTEFFGAVYAPNCDLILGTNPTDFNGAISARTIRVLGSPTLRYDKNLRNVSFNGTTKFYTLSSWTELVDDATRVTLP